MRGPAKCTLELSGCDVAEPAQAGPGHSPLPVLAPFSLCPHVAENSQLPGVSDKNTNLLLRAHPPDIT